jgi:hypothetical protein
LSISQAAVISPMWLNACGKLPSSSPRGLGLDRSSSAELIAGDRDQRRLGETGQAIGGREGCPLVQRCGQPP